MTDPAQLDAFQKEIAEDFDKPRAPVHVSGKFMVNHEGTVDGAQIEIEYGAPQAP